MRAGAAANQEPAAFLRRWGREEIGTCVHCGHYLFAGIGGSVTQLALMNVRLPGPGLGP